MRIFEGFEHGINLGGWLSQCGQPDRAHVNSFITQDDFSVISGMGFDHVRLPVDYFFLESDGGEANPLGWEALDRCAGLCARNHLSLLIDLHKAYGYTFDPSDKNADRAAFFSDPALQARFFALWRRLAQRFGGDEHIAFDLLNEVVLPEVAQQWNKVAAGAIAVIRQETKTTPILAGGARYNHVSSVPDLVLPPDDHLVYGFHCYDPLVFTHQGAPWVENMDPAYRLDYPGNPEDYAAGNRALNKNHAAGKVPEKMGSDYFENLFAPAVAHAEKNNVPLYCGEYGVIDRADPEAALRWLEDITAVFEHHGIGRALWTWKQMDFGLTDLHYAPVRARIAALICHR